MGKAKISITGELQKGFKVNEDRTVNILLKADTSDTVPKGLKLLGESIYNICISSKAWGKVSSDIKNDSKLLIQGEPKAMVNTKGVPYILVNCMDIKILEPKIKDADTKEMVISEVKKITISENKEKISNTSNIENLNIKEEIKKSIANNEINVPLKNRKYINNNKGNISSPKDYKIANKWYKENEFVVLNLDDISLVEHEHMQGCVITAKNLYRFKEERFKCTVREISNGKYGLVMGFTSFVMARVLGYKTIKAVITDLGRKEFKDKTGITT